MALGQTTEGEFLDGAIAFEIPADLRVPRELRQKLQGPAGNFRLQRRKIEDARFPLELYGAHAPLRFDDLLADDTLHLQFVVTNADAHKPANTILDRPQWGAQLKILRGEQLLQVIEYTACLIPAFPNELPREALEARTQLQYWEYRRISHYKSSTVVWRVLATPFAVAADIAGCVVIAVGYLWIESETDDC